MNVKLSVIIFCCLRYMSFLIQYQSILFYSQPPPPQQTSIPSSTSNFSQDGEVLEITRILEKMVSSIRNQSSVILYSKNTIVLNILLPGVYKQISVSAKISIHLKNHTIKIQYLLVNSDQSFMKINSNQRRLFASKVLAFFNKVDPYVFNQNKITIQMSSGLLKIENPHYYQLSTSLKYLGNNAYFLFNCFISNIQNLHEYLYSLIQVSNASPKACLSGIICKNDGVRMTKIIKYSKLLNILLSLDTEQTSEEQSLKRSILIEIKSLQNASLNFIKVDKDFESSLLYSNQHLSFTNKSVFLQIDHSLHVKENKEIKIKLDIPQVTAMQNNKRVFIVNHLKLIKIYEETKMRIAEGGFAKIYLTDVEYQAINSHQLGKKQPLQDGLQHQVRRSSFIIKRQTKLGRQRRSRIRHQKQLLTKIKSAFAIFIPRYYFIFNETEQNRFDLLQDHINYQGSTMDLGDYTKKFQLSISQQTKVYFAYSILQGLRYLKDYQISHLDLKPGNVMITKKLTLKLIDFGQSFHPHFKNHKPGISMPYSAPQNYKPQKHYDHKNDVFSFGIMLHHLLTNRYPFFIYSNKDREEVFMNNSLSQRWFFTPQGMVQYGQRSIFPFLQLLVGKCLDSDPQRRPQLEWVYLILRQYLQLFR